MRTYRFADPAWLTKPEVIRDILTEAEGSHELPKGVIMQLRAKVAHAGKVTSNGRWYSKKVMSAGINKLQESIGNREIEGLAGHPKKIDEGIPDPKDASYLITGLEMNEDGEVYMTSDVYDTTEGRNLAARVRAGAKVGFSTRGRGNKQTVKLTDQHEAAKENPDWLGRDVDVIQDDYRLLSVDHVIGQAIGDATLDGYVEHEETESEDEVMDKFDMSKLTEEQWKEILESEKVTGLVMEAVNEAVAQCGAKFQGALDEAEQFIDEHFEIVETDEDGNPVEEDEDGEDEGEQADEATAGKCPECGAKVGKAMKFCPECGADLVGEDEEADEGGDAPSQTENEETQKLRKRLADLEKREAERVEADALKATVGEALKGQPREIVESVVNDVAQAGVKSEKAKEFCEARVEHYKNLIKRVGGTVRQPEGVAPAGSLDALHEGGKPKDAIDSLIGDAAKLMG